VQSIAKISPPRLSNVFPRRRLFGLLDRKRTRPVTWVVGPPGGGKTTAVASYLGARSVRPLWYQLDEVDGDPATFFYYLALAVKKAAPRRRKPLPLFTPEHRRSLSMFTLRWCQSLQERLPRPCALVLDNYHEVAADSLLHTVLATMFSCLRRGASS
jgi:ATP/maltotriose-dependent transcriptional regulator MalT